MRMWIMSQQEGLLAKQNWPFLTTTVSKKLCLSSHFRTSHLYCNMKKVVAACMITFAKLSEHWQLKPGLLKFNSEAIASFSPPSFCLTGTKFSLDLEWSIHWWVVSITYWFLKPLCTLPAWLHAVHVTTYERPHSCASTTCWTRSPI